MRNLREEIIKSAAKKILFTSHSLNQMNLPERIITTDEVREVIGKGEIIEEYPEDRRGYSCLLFCYVESRPLHVVCSPKKDYLAIITAYIPNSKEWSNDFGKRRK